MKELVDYRKGTSRLRKLRLGKLRLSEES